MSEMIGRQVAIAATRQVAFEAWSEELLRLLITSGVVSAPDIAIMLGRLHARLAGYESDPAGTYLIDAQTLKAEAGRVARLQASVWN